MDPIQNSPVQCIKESRPSKTVWSKIVDLFMRILMSPFHLTRSLFLTKARASKSISHKPLTLNPLVKADVQLEPYIPHSEKQQPRRHPSNPINPHDLQDLQALHPSFAGKAIERLTPEMIQKSSGARAAIHQFLEQHPTSSLFPLLGMNGNYVPKLLACIESPVISAAMNQSMLEQRNSLINSPLFEGAIGKKVADFIEGKKLDCSFSEWSLLYTTAHTFQMERLLQECRAALLRHVEWRFEMHQLEPLWGMAEFYGDQALQLACVNFALTQNTSELPPTLKERCELAKALPLVGKLHISQDRYVEATLKHFDQSVVERCKTAGVDALQLLEADPLSDQAVDSLKNFRSLNLDFASKYERKDDSLLSGIVKLVEKSRNLEELNLSLGQIQQADALVTALKKHSDLQVNLRFTTIQPLAEVALKSCNIKIIS